LYLPKIRSRLSCIIVIMLYDMSVPDNDNGRGVTITIVVVNMYIIAKTHRIRRRKNDDNVIMIYRRWLRSPRYRTYIHRAHAGGDNRDNIIIWMTTCKYNIISTHFPRHHSIVSRATQLYQAPATPRLDDCPRSRSTAVRITPMSTVAVLTVVTVAVAVWCWYWWCWWWRSSSRWWWWCCFHRRHRLSAAPPPRMRACIGRRECIACKRSASQININNILCYTHYNMMTIREKYCNVI